MASLREIRRKIKSVKNTQQITRAMKMVASARLRRAQSQALTARPFAQRIEDLIRDLSVRVQASRREETPLHPLLEKCSSNEEGMVIVTADKGLCGSFNTNIIRKALNY